jgi:hypothetical protein
MEELSRTSDFQSYILGKISMVDHPNITTMLQSVPVSSGILRDR